MRYRIHLSFIYRNFPQNNRIDGVTVHPRQIGLTYLFPSVVPAPITVSTQLSMRMTSQT